MLAAVSHKIPLITRYTHPHTRSPADAGERREAAENRKYERLAKVSK